MLTFISSELANTIAVEISGKPEKEDVVKLKEAVEEKFGADEKFNLLITVKNLETPTIEGITERLKFLANHHERINRAAIVSEMNLASVVKSLANVIPHTEAKRFGLAERDSAWKWLRQ